MSDNVTGTLNGSNLKLSCNIFMRTFLSAVLNVVLYMSLLMIAINCTTKSVGTEIYQKGADGSYTKVTEIYTADSAADDSASTAKADETANDAETSQAEASEALEKGDTQTSSTNTYVSYPIRTNMPTSAKILTNVAAEILMVILLIALPYSKLWSVGDRDSNSVQFGHREEDQLRGLKIGLLAGIPSFLSYGVLLVAKIGKILPDYFSVYRYLNFTFFPIISLMTPSEDANAVSQMLSADVSWPLMAVLLLTIAVIPFTCYAAYALGYHHISISEKFIYVNPSKKKKKRR